MYPYKFCVVSFVDDGYSEHHSSCFFCELDDAMDFYKMLQDSGTPCMFYRLYRYANLKV